MPGAHTSTMSLTQQQLQVAAVLKQYVDLDNDFLEALCRELQVLTDRALASQSKSLSNHYERKLAIQAGEMAAQHKQDKAAQDLEHEKAIAETVAKYEEERAVQHKWTREQMQVMIIMAHQAREP